MPPCKLSLSSNLSNQTPRPLSLSLSLVYVNLEIVLAAATDLFMVISSFAMGGGEALRFVRVSHFHINLTRSNTC
jgi:hypothetical protein